MDVSYVRILFCVSHVTYHTRTMYIIHITCSTTFCRSSHEANTRMIILGEDGLRSQYVPPKPMLKILKRPTRDSQGSGDGPLNDDKPKQPIKSLKQVRNCVVIVSPSCRAYEECNKFVLAGAGICRGTQEDSGRREEPGREDDTGD